MLPVVGALASGPANIAFAQSPAAEKLQQKKQSLGAPAETHAGDKVTRLEAAFLDARLDTRVTVGGRRNERLHIRYALCSRVFMHELHKTELGIELPKAGFTDISCTDAFGETWGLRYK